MTAALRLHTKICIVCDRAFQVQRSDARTCSPRCRKELSRRQRAELSEMLIERTVLDFDDSEDPTAIAIALFKDLRKKLLKRDQV